MNKKVRKIIFIVLILILTISIGIPLYIDYSVSKIIKFPDSDMSYYGVRISTMDVSSDGKYVAGLYFFTTQSILDARVVLLNVSTDEYSIISPPEYDHNIRSNIRWHPSLPIFSYSTDTSGIEFGDFDCGYYDITSEEFVGLQNCVLDWLPNGNYIGSDLNIHSISSTNVTSFLSSENDIGDIREISVSGDGGAVAIIDREFEIHIYRAETKGIIDEPGKVVYPYFLDWLSEDILLYDTKGGRLIAYDISKACNVFVDVEFPSSVLQKLGQIDILSIQRTENTDFLLVSSSKKGDGLITSGICEECNTITFLFSECINE